MGDGCGEDYTLAREPAGLRLRGTALDARRLAGRVPPRLTLPRTGQTTHLLTSLHRPRKDCGLSRGEPAFHRHPWRQGTASARLLHLDHFRQFERQLVARTLGLAA